MLNLFLNTITGTWIHVQASFKEYFFVPTMLALALQHYLLVFISVVLSFILVVILIAFGKFLPLKDPIPSYAMALMWSSANLELFASSLALKGGTWCGNFSFVDSDSFVSFY